jgi:hypothetical protein
MPHVLTRFADGLLARLVPQLAAQAGFCNIWQYCYCSRGVAYRRHIWNSPSVWRCTECIPSGTC